MELFVQLFEGCEWGDGVASALRLLQSQIDEYGLIFEDADGKNQYEQGSLETQYLMIRLCKQINKQIKNSGLPGENSYKTSIKALLGRTIPICRSSGLNLSGRFSSASTANAVPLEQPLADDSGDDGPSARTRLLYQ